MAVSVDNVYANALDKLMRALEADDRSSSTAYGIALQGAATVLVARELGRVAEMLYTCTSVLKCVADEMPAMTSAAATLSTTLSKAGSTARRASRRAAKQHRRRR